MKEFIEKKLPMHVAHERDSAGAQILAEFISQTIPNLQNFQNVSAIQYVCILYVDDYCTYYVYSIMHASDGGT